MIKDMATVQQIIATALIKNGYTVTANLPIGNKMSVVIEDNGSISLIPYSDNEPTTNYNQVDLNGCECTSCGHKTTMWEAKNYCTNCGKKIVWTPFNELPEQYQKAISEDPLLFEDVHDPFMDCK